MDDNRLSKYLDEIGAEQQLTAEEERSLSARSLSGDEQAQQRLVVANLKLVVAVANGYKGRGLSMDDLVSEGNFGLMKAAAKFDAKRGARFANYAVNLIRQHIERALAAEGEGVQSTAESAKSKVSGGVKVRSVDAPLGVKPNMSLLSVLADAGAPIADQDILESNSLEALEKALTVLNEREQHVVKAFFGIGQEPQTMAEIGMDMGLKRERVRQIRNRALRRLKKNTVRGY